jgi:hypothetical protein
VRSTIKSVRQSVSLPTNVAAVESGIEAEKRKQQEFVELAERFRDARDPKEIKRLGDRLGRIVFGG